MPAIQDNRNIAIGGALGANLLLFQRMSGEDGLSTLGEYRLELLSERADLRIDDVLGRELSVALTLPAGGARQFNGVVTRFALSGRQGRYASYQATLRPWLWFLTRGADCCIFQQKNLLDILKAVFGKYDYADYDMGGLAGSYPLLEYCVQYRESDFQFVSRLMERYGIYYYFRHDGGRHTMVLADSYAAHAAIPGYAELRYAADDEEAMRRGEVVYSWLMSGEILADGQAMQAYDFEKPSGNLQVRSAQMRKYERAGHEVYDYPGDYRERGGGEAAAQVRLEALQSGYETVSARATARGVAPGGLFKLRGHARDDQNRDMLVTAARYTLCSDQYQAARPGVPEPLFDCSFSALGKEHNFRAPQVTPKPVVRGPQTAIVVGKAGEEIWTDKYGRIKVQFHWDRVGQDDESSSCWVRVAQGWAGRRWGQLSIPRIGQEVVVGFLEGDADQPLVTGSVYNADCMPPLKLPEQASRSTLKSNSTKGGDGYNELRFEDKKGAEQVFLRAERNQDQHVGNDLLQWIGHHRHLIVEGDDLEQVGGDRHITVKGDSNEKIGGAASLDVGAAVHLRSGMQTGLDAGSDIHLKAGMNVVIEAGASITLKAGGGSVVIGPTGVAITGTPVLLNSGGAAGSGAGVAPKAPAAPEKAEDGSK